MKNKIKKTNFNKLRYNNVLESKPREINLVINDSILNDEPQSNFMFNECKREDALLAGYKNDKLYESDGFILFLEKCEKEILNYARRVSETGCSILQRGTYDAGKREAHNFYLNRGKKKTMQKITPNNSPVEFFHACLQYFVDKLISRYMVMYSDVSEKTYNTIIKSNHDLDDVIDIGLFTPPARLLLNYDYFKTHKDEIFKKKVPTLKKEYNNFYSAAQGLFFMQSLLTTEEIMPWSKDLSATVGLYPLLNGVWIKAVRELYIDILYKQNLKELNDEKLTSNYYSDKMYNNEKILKGTIPATAYNATQEIATCTDYMFKLFRNTLNKMFDTICKLAMTNTESTFADEKSLAFVKNSMQNNLKEKYEKEIEEKEKKYNELKAEFEKIEKKYSELQQSSSVNKLKEKIKKLEKIHKNDSKQVLALQAKIRKQEKEYEEEIVLLKDIKTDIEESVPIKGEIIPELSENLKIAFCLEDKPGFEQPAQSLIDEFTNSTIVYFPNQLTNQDVAVFLTEMMGHPLYYDFKETAKNKGIQAWHTIHKNPKLIRTALATYLFHKNNQEA